MSLKILKDKVMKSTRAVYLKRKRFLLVLSLTSYVLYLTCCTKDLNINLPHQEQQIVVEGHIETGTPPYVILTRSSDFYSTFYLDSISNYFIHGAIVKVSNGVDTV